MANRLSDKLVMKLPYSAPYNPFGPIAAPLEVTADGATVPWSASSFDTVPELYAGPLNGTLPPDITAISATLTPDWGRPSRSSGPATASPCRAGCTTRPTTTRQSTTACS